MTLALFLRCLVFLVGCRSLSSTSYSIVGALSQGTTTSASLHPGQALYRSIIPSEIWSWSFALAPPSTCGVLVCAAKTGCSSLNVSAIVAAEATACAAIYSRLAGCWSSFVMQSRTIEMPLCLLLVNTNGTASVQIAYDIMVAGQESFTGNLLVYILLGLGGGLVLIVAVKCLRKKPCTTATPTAIPFTDPPYQLAQVQITQPVTEVATISPRNVDSSGVEPWIEACVVEMEEDEASKPANPS